MTFVKICSKCCFSLRFYKDYFHHSWTLSYPLLLKTSGKTHSQLASDWSLHLSSNPQPTPPPLKLNVNPDLEPNQRLRDSQRTRGQKEKWKFLEERRLNHFKLLRVHPSPCCAKQFVFQVRCKPWKQLLAHNSN